MSDPRHRSQSKAFGTRMFDRTAKILKLEDWGMAHVLSD